MGAILATATEPGFPSYYLIFRLDLAELSPVVAILGYAALVSNLIPVTLVLRHRTLRYRQIALVGFLIVAAVSWH